MIQKYFFERKRINLPTLLIKMQPSCCPITHTDTRFLEEPVVSSVDGHTYEKQAILQWLKHKSISPVTREPMNKKDLIPNRALMGSDSGTATRASERFFVICIDSTQTDHESDECVETFKKGAARMIESMDSSSLCAILTFGTRCTQVMIPTPMTRHGKRQALRSLEFEILDEYGDVVEATTRALECCQPYNSLPLRVVIMTSGQTLQLTDNSMLERFIEREEKPTDLLVHYVSLGETNSLCLDSLCQCIENVRSRATFNFSSSVPEFWRGLCSFWANAHTGIYQGKASKRERWISLLEELDKCCTKVADPSWYGLPGRAIEIAPSPAQIKKAMGIYKGYTDLREKQIIEFLKDVNGRHRIRSLLRAHKQQSCIDHSISSLLCYTSSKEWTNIRSQLVNP